MTARPSSSPRSRRISIATVLVVAALAITTTADGAQSRTESPRPFVLRGGTVIDGSGAPGYLGDVLVRDGLIEAIGLSGSDTTPADMEIVDITGLVVAPGFIDIHNHSTNRLAGDPAATTQVAQGVTTIVVGPDGSSPLPIDEWLAGIDALAPALDVATMVGHGTVRAAVLGEDWQRPATAQEMVRMAGLVDAAMRAGAFGLSTGLEYDPGRFSTTAELIHLAAVAARAGGFYMSHLRDEEENLLDAVDEALQIGAEADTAVQISHIKAGDTSSWGQSGEVLRRIEAARAAGIDVTADQYPYLATQTSLALIVPSREFDDDALVEQGLQRAGGAQRLQIMGFEPRPDFHGQRLDAIARALSMTEVRAYQYLMASGGAGMIAHVMHDDDVDTFMVSPWVMTASDGGVGSSHPRGAGSFARVLGYYVRERGLLTLERAVQRATSQPAARLKLEDRGVLEAGRRADLVVFDPATVAARSTFEAPLELAEGVVATWVGGVAVWRDGATTGARPGRALRRSG